MDWSRIREVDALVLTALIWFLAKFVRYAFPPLFGTFQAEFGVSTTAVGTAFGAMMLVYALMQFPSGALADRLGSVRVVTAGALVAAAGSLSLVVIGAVASTLRLVDPFAALIAGMLLVGLGTGAHKTVAVRLLSRAYPDRTGRALGVLDTVGAFGGVAAPAAVVAVTGATLLDWRAPFLGGAVAGATLAGLFALLVPRRLPDDRAAAVGGAAGAESSTPDGRGGGLRRYAALFADRRFALFVAVTVCSSFAYNGAVAFLPLYLTESAGLTPAFAGLLYSGLFVVSLVQMVTGELSDRVGQLPMIGATLALAAAGLAFLLVADGPAALAVAVVAFGLGSHGFRPVRGSYLVSVIPESVAGGTLGVVRTLIMGAGALAPATVGYLSDAVGFGVAFLALAMSMTGAVVVAGVLLGIGSSR